jgi:hypothetical protein
MILLLEGKMSVEYEIENAQRKLENVNIFNIKSKAFHSTSLSL